MSLTDSCSQRSICYCLLQHLHIACRCCEPLCYTAEITPHRFPNGPAFLIAAALPILFCFALYRMVFDYTDVGNLFWVGILHLLAPAILLFGLVMLAGRKKEAAVYIMIAAVLIIHIFEVPIPGVINNSGNTAAYDNVLTPTFVVQQAAYAAVGAAYVAVSLFLLKKSRAG